MTWMIDLYQTYENNLDQIGNPRIKNKQSFSLLPVGHAYRNAQIEVTVTTDGEFYDARILSKDEAPTIVPVTEDSGGRTNKEVPHPLHDGLKYVAGDFSHYVETKGKNPTAYQLYIDQLAKWSQTNPRVQAVYQYLKKKRLISDLIGNGKLFIENEQLIPKWTKDMTEKRGEKPEIFKVISSTQDAAFVRFTVHDIYDSLDEVPLWEDLEVQQASIDFFSEGKTGIDYVTGEKMRITDSHASGLRYAGDMAKLISANDDKNYTYRGRFVDKDEAVQIGYEISQKAHSALKWLITKQGIVRDGRVFLIWGNELPETITPLIGGSKFSEDDDEEGPQDLTQEEYAKLISSAIYGKNRELATHAKVSILILDNATPGRVGILYYNAMDQMHYLKRIEDWQLKSSWRHKYFRNKQLRFSYGAPNMNDIVEDAYGENASDKVKKNALTTLFTCVVDGRPVPQDMLRKLVHRASNRASFSDKERYKWERIVESACSLVNNYYYKGGEKVSLNKESKERNYLFGRLLAVSHVVETNALKEQGAKQRTTNAERYMNAFSMRPVKTWQIIRENLQPYITRLGGKATRYNKIFDEIMNQFEESTYTDKPLDGRYLLGYYSQEYDIYHKETEEEK